MRRHWTTLIMVVVLGLATVPSGILATAQDGIESACPECGEAEPAAEYVPDEVLVRFWPAVSKVRAAQVVSAEGAEHARGIPSLGVQVLRLPPGQSVEQAVARFNRRPEVDYAEPNYILHIALDPEPGLDNQWGPQQIEAEAAWDITIGSPDVVIAVVDTGVDYGHTELDDNMWAGNANHGWDFVNSDDNPMDDNGHGTFVAGVAAAEYNANGAGLVGICPSCTIMAVKVMGADGSGLMDTVANGITYAADNGADVISLSLGILGSLADPGQMQTLEAAVDHAWDNGAVVAAATGNDGVEAEYYPAGFDHAMGVASSNRDDYHSCFSNTGVGLVSVTAPGEEIYSSYWVSTTPGQDDYATGSGTSAATPHVAGLAGLLLSNEPTLTNDQVRSRIENTADDLGPQGLDMAHGSGRINALRALTPSLPAHPRVYIEPLSTFHSASGYAHARKLVRDDSDTLHLVWHTHQVSDAEPYQIHYSTSTDNGQTWRAPTAVFSSSAPTYHPALAIGNGYLYLAFPSLHDPDPGLDSPYYRTWFSRRSLLDPNWEAAELVIDIADHDAVRPDLHFDASTNRLHLVATSNDDHPYVYYTASGDGGQNWDGVQGIDPRSTETQSDTRYAAVYAHGATVHIVSRTVYKICVLNICIGYYYSHTHRSTDGGQTWPVANKDQFATCFGGGERGLSLAGVSDHPYMAYEVCGSLFFRRFDPGTQAWMAHDGLSEYDELNVGGRWPTITQADDGQAWAIWEDAGSLLMKHYAAESGWEQENETLPPPAGHSQALYPNLKLGTSGNRVEWVTNYCPATPFRLVVESRSTGEVDPPPTVRIDDPTEGQTVAGVHTVRVHASDDNALTSVELSIDGGAYQDITGSLDGTHYTYDWDTTSPSYPDGAHWLQARATDDAAQTSTSAVRNVTVDNVNDPPAASVIAPAHGSQLSGPVLVQIDASDAEDAQGDLTVQWQVDGTGWQPATHNPVTGYYEEMWDTTSVADGGHTLDARATDSAGTTTDASQVSATTENVNAEPAVDLVAPPYSSTVAGTVTVQISASDEEDAPQDLTVEWRIDSGSWQPAAYNTDTGYHEANWETGGYSDGSHTLSARATDSFPVTAYSDPVLVTVDNEDVPPNVVIVFPPNSSTVSGVVTVKISATDAEDAEGTLAVDWNVDGRDWQTTTYHSGTSYYEATWDTVTAGIGPHTFNARAIDSANNTSTDSTSVTVEAGGGTTVHVGDLDGIRRSVRNTWTAEVMVAVHDAGEGSVAGARVDGTWSDGAGGTGWCITQAGGVCTIEKALVPKKISSVVFTVTGVSSAGHTYEPLDNHDPDGDSNGTRITVPPPANQPPVALFDYVCNDQTCEFDASGSYDLDGSVVSYAWDFGDGNGGSGMTPSHTYTADSTYAVELTVTDDLGATGTASESVTVGSGGSSTMHVGGLDASSILVKRNTRWNATVTITVHDGAGAHAPLPDVTVAGAWSDGATGTVECTTDGSGQCDVTKTNLKLSVTSVTFTVVGLTHATDSYVSAENHDPGGPNPGIVVSPP